MSRSPAIRGATSPISARSTTPICSIYSTRSATRAGSAASTGQRATPSPASAGRKNTALGEPAMRIVITGGCGFLGRRVALKLLAEGSALGRVDELALFDNAPSALPLPEDKRLTLVTGDIADRETIARLITHDTAAVFHLAAIVLRQAEPATELGYRV